MPAPRRRDGRLCGEEVGMDQVVAYLIVVLAVLGLNLLPAFGPPTWAVLVLFNVHGEYALPVLVVLGAAAAATGRLLLAHGTRQLRRFLPEHHRKNLEAAGRAITERRGRAIAGLALFAVSPLPSAQLFEAAGLLRSARLLPLTGAFFVGRVVSYAVYVGGSSALKTTSTGQLLLSSLTSPWGVALQVALLAGLVLLARVDWAGVLEADSRGATQHRPRGTVRLMSDNVSVEVPGSCPLCGAELESATIDFDPDNEPRAELNPGEMAKVDFCPNPDCPGKRQV
jgi:hypothetical protein